MSEKKPIRPASEAEQRFVARGEYITLGQLLKAAGVLGTGGEVKSYLAAATILVNGEPEQRRGRKLYPGDLVAVRGEAPIRIAAATGEAEQSGA
jgi:S4 domain protein YaaA